MEGQHQSIDRPIDVVIAAQRMRQKLMGGHHSGSICRSIPTSIECHVLISYVLVFGDCSSTSKNFDPYIMSAVVASLSERRCVASIDNGLCFSLQIPFFPLVKKDLTFTHFGNDSRVDGLVNFAKLRMISKQIRQFVALADIDTVPPRSLLVNVSVY